MKMKKKELKKDLNYYMSLKYKVQFIESESGGYFAEIPDLPGCMTHAETFEELPSMIEDAKKAWIETRLEKGLPVPEPSEEEEYSGKFVVRMLKSLHAKLAEQAKKEGVSLNQYVVSLLAEAIGVKQHKEELQEIKTSIEKLNVVPIQRTSMIIKEQSLTQEGFGTIPSPVARSENPIKKKEEEIRLQP